MKNFFASKINWSGIMVMIIGLQDFITNADFTMMTAKGWITFAMGGLIVVLRTYFTSKAINTGQK